MPKAAAEPTELLYTLQDIDLAELQRWAPTVEAKLKTIPGVQDVASDLQFAGPQMMIEINGDLAARVGVPRLRSKARSMALSASAM